MSGEMELLVAGEIFSTVLLYIKLFIGSWPVLSNMPFLSRICLDLFPYDQNILINFFIVLSFIVVHDTTSTSIVFRGLGE